MASTFSNLKIELIGTGEQVGTWGSTTNTNLGTALEEAIVGSADVSFSSADVTLALTNSNGTQAARHVRLNLTGVSGGARQLILGAGCQIDKPYIINNGLADAVTVKNTTGTGVVVPAGKSMWVFNNGVNVVEITTHTPVSSGGTGASTLTANNVILGNGTSAPLFVAPGANGNVLTSNGTTWTSASTAPGGVTSVTASAPLASSGGATPNISVTGILAVANGGTGTASPSLQPGSNVTISGSWPNQTISSTASGGGGTVTSVSGTGSASGLSLSGTVTTSGNLTLSGTVNSLSSFTTIPADGFLTAAGTAVGFGFGNASQGHPNAIIPPNPSTYTLGRSGQAWSTIYVATAPVVGSDERDKIVLGATPGLDFITRLNPIQYKLKIGEYDVKVIPDTNPPEYNKTPIPGHRIHYGMLAQQVKSVIDELQLPDFAGWVSADPADSQAGQSLRYEEFVAPIIKAIQESMERIKILEAEIALLKK